MTDITNEIKPQTIKKDAGVAAVLNTIFPGLGWIYCEKILAGIISMVIDVILVYQFFFGTDREIFCIIYLIYWIIQINLVCEYANPKATIGLSDFLNSLDDKDWEPTTKNRTTTNGRSSIEKI